MFFKNTMAAALLCFGAAFSNAAFGAIVPSSIDPGRIDRKPETMPLTVPAPVVLPKVKVEQTNVAPAGSNKISFTLHSVKFDGMHAFTAGDVADIWEPYQDKKITLDILWLMAGKLTERYQAKGYFLSRVYVPAQEIEGGNITLKVVEGYISDIHFDDAARDHGVVQALFNELLEKRPLDSKSLESMLLRLNDLPGISVRGVLSLPDAKNAPEGATGLDIIRTPEANRGKISFDNNGSRFLGPYEGSAQYQAEIIPLEKTTFSILGASQLDELRYGSLRHEIPIFPNATLEAYVTYTKANPGYTLEIQDIRSKSLATGIDLNYQWVRQRDENFSTKIALDARETRSTILGTPLTDDSVRALRASASYDTVDRWRGYNQISSTLTQGINGLGSSQAGDPSLSRPNAKPDFEKAEMTLSRLQALGTNFNAFAAVSGQISSGTLYSSEQFGYGGQAFGRAYDASEITGDEGVAGALELRYTGLSDENYFFTPIPYVFYDIGTVWSDDPSQPDISGSSAGAGFRTTTDIGVATNLGLAFPLTKRIDTPLYTHNGMSPRLIFEVSYGF